LSEFRCERIHGELAPISYACDGFSRGLRKALERLMEIRGNSAGADGVKYPVALDFQLVRRTKRNASIGCDLAAYSVVAMALYPGLKYELAESGEKTACACSTLVCQGAGSTQAKAPGGR
jgi:hypothetical protein